jgi:Domain of Unknown Function (DUF928)
MNYRRFAGTVGLFALVASSLLAAQSAQAIGFTPPPGSGTPPSSTGGASRGMMFTPQPGRSSPNTATGGASRGVMFKPAASRNAPRQATGGASRNSMFRNRANPTARRAVGGASRGIMFRNTANPVARRTAGGASRGTLFVPKSGNGSPGSAAGGASRDGVYPGNPSIVGAVGPASLMALLPNTYFGTTLQERPTLLVYIPVSQANEADFSLKDEAGNTLFEMTIPVSGYAGVLTLQLPSDAPALEMGKNYQWFMALKVDGELKPSTPYVDGWIQRIQPSEKLATALQQAGDPLKLATAFGQEGVWYDCVATLAALRNGQADNVALNKHWSELMASVGLKDIDTAPMLVWVDQKAQ